MRIVLWSVTVLALATTLDSYHYDGRYTQSVARFVANVWVSL